MAITLKFYIIVIKFIYRIIVKKPQYDNELKIKYNYIKYIKI